MFFLVTSKSSCELWSIEELLWEVCGVRKLKALWLNKCGFRTHCAQSISFTSRPVIHLTSILSLSLSHSQAIPTCQIKIFILFLSSHLGRSFTKVEATARAALEPSALLYGLTPTTGLLTTIWIEVAPVACCHCV